MFTSQKSSRSQRSMEEDSNAGSLSRSGSISMSLASSHNKFVRSGSREDYVGGRMSSRASSRRESITLSRDELLDSWVAQAGDSGDRVVDEDDEDDNESMGSTGDKGGARGHGIRSCAVSPLEEEVVSHLPSDSILDASEKDEMVIGTLKDKQEKLPRSLDYVSYMIHLAVFGELGVFTRYLLQRLFGPDLLALTSDQTPLYLDLPANMVGSFLMGWFGVVFKSDISHILSDQIAVGLTTGYLGSLTTFSGWNQKMLNLSTGGHWVFAMAGIIFGILLVIMSIIMGVESAKALRTSIVDRFGQESQRPRCRLEYWRVNSRRQHMVVMIFMLLILLAILGLSGILVRIKLDRFTNGTVLWLGCLVGPPGVWGRWYFARLNGQGIGRKGWLKWFPMGTLLANVLAACLMAALATISKAVNTTRCGIIVSGIQFGFLGCLSTVSTFVAEVYAMSKNKHNGRALAYVAVTLITSFIMGTFIYSIPVWETL